MLVSGIGLIGENSKIDLVLRSQVKESIGIFIASIVNDLLFMSCS